MCLREIQIAYEVRNIVAKLMVILQIKNGLLQRQQAVFSEFSKDCLERLPRLHFTIWGQQWQLNQQELAVHAEQLVTISSLNCNKANQVPYRLTLPQEAAEVRKAGIGRQQVGYQNAVTLWPKTLTAVIFPWQHGVIRLWSAVRNNICIWNDASIVLARCRKSFCSLHHLRSSNNN